MNETTDFHDLPKNVTDFSVLIAWSGAEDKPFYRARLLSQSRSHLIANEPFWGYAVISPEEFNKLVDILNASQHQIFSGHHPGEESEYYIELQIASEVYYCSLGFDQNTVDILTQIMGALEAKNRKPIRDILARTSPIFGSGPLGRPM